MNENVTNAMEELLYSHKYVYINNNKNYVCTQNSASIHQKLFMYKYYKSNLKSD